MFTANKFERTTTSALLFPVLAGILLSGATLSSLRAQAPDPSAISPAEPSSIALSLPEDRGQNSLEQSLKRLSTTASVMMIVAHPDDEDGSLLTYLSRGLGARCVLFTLNRGEGGQNVMTGDTYDALGVMRTNELLTADEYYGAKQLWGTEVDFGFSKTQEESFARWGHDRVLYDAVLAVRRERPQVIVSTFVGAVSDGHGQHQVSGEIAQEVFKAAGDPKIFPDQLKDGLQPWQPLAVYSMVPFAPINNGKVFDYATGKQAPADFKNYVTGEVTHGDLSADATIPVGNRDPFLGRSYVQISRQGWGEQKSQNGGSNPTLSGPATTRYHLWAAVPAVSSPGAEVSGGLFGNSKVHIDTSIQGLAHLAGAPGSPWVPEALIRIQNSIESAVTERQGKPPIDGAHLLARAYKQTLDLRARIANESTLSAQARSSLLFELDNKIADFQSALKQLLGLDLVAFTTSSAGAPSNSPRGASADESPSSVSPGQQFRVRVHVSQAGSDARLAKVWLESASGDPWKFDPPSSAPDSDKLVVDSTFTVQAAPNAQPTAPFYTRPTIEQPYYDIANEAWRERSFMPWPLAAWAEFTFDGLPIRLGEAVQTLQRISGPGGFYQPLVVTPQIGLTVSPDARILPLDGRPLPVSVTLHTQGAADGVVTLSLPPNWQAQPAEAAFHRTAAGDSEPIQFLVTAGAAAAGHEYSIQAVTHSDGKDYASGWRSVGWQGLRPYNVYRPSELKTRKVDVKLAPGLRIAYVMGPGDLVPDAIEAMGAPVHLLSSAELASADLSQWNVILLGIRAYATRPELLTVQPRLDAFVRAGGTLIVQYQSANFPAPLPLTLGRAERVIDEQAPVKLLDPSNPLLTFPNRITSADFDGWVEERGHSFLQSWDPAFTTLTETADAGQDPQRGGLVIARAGKGTYIYVAFALYRQLPELVPGAYRLLANLLSAGAAPARP